MSEAVARHLRPQGVHSAADLSRLCDWGVATKASPIFLGVGVERRQQDAGRLSAPVCALMSARGVGISTCRCIVAVVRDGGRYSSAGRCAVAASAVGARVCAEVARRQ
ncbi:hypothetical protein ED328_07695 [Muribaculaceae bacterium Isolate-001 (NCI)]|nr:hypothetical protein ED328_07695 [Muribaculaceae bacterium Isolate-001 (NCI)]